MILIVSHADDAQGDRVCAELKKAEHAFQRIGPTSLGADTLFSIRPQAEGFAENRVFSTFRDGFDQASEVGARFDAVYWRRPIRPQDRLAIAFPLASEIATAEAYHAFRLAIEALPPSLFPLGHPLPMERASNKLLQLHLAERMGFSTPDTLLSNDPAALEEFLQHHAEIAVKPVHAHACYKAGDRSQIEQPLWCRGAESKDLLERLAPDRRAQLMVQQRIEKKEDWRITVLPQRSFYCKIDTADLPSDQPDWRKQPRLLTHSLFEPPAGFDDALRAYMEELDLKAGYFDFAIPKDGEDPCFLEVNTNAQWDWIEERTGAPIAAEVARTLARAH